jgi:hypothetical protein
VIRQISVHSVRKASHHIYAPSRIYGRALGYHQYPYQAIRSCPTQSQSRRTRTTLARHAELADWNIHRSTALVFVEVLSLYLRDLCGSLIEYVSLPRQLTPWLPTGKA